MIEHRVYAALRMGDSTVSDLIRLLGESQRAIAFALKALRKQKKAAVVELIGAHRAALWTCHPAKVQQANEETRLLRRLERENTPDLQQLIRERWS